MGGRETPPVLLILLSSAVPGSSATTALHLAADKAPLTLLSLPLCCSSLCLFLPATQVAGLRLPTPCLPAPPPAPPSPPPLCLGCPPPPRFPSVPPPSITSFAPVSPSRPPYYRSFRLHHNLSLGPQQQLPPALPSLPGLAGAVKTVKRKGSGTRSPGEPPFGQPIPSLARLRSSSKSNLPRFHPWVLSSCKAPDANSLSPPPGLHVGNKVAKCPGW